MKIFNCNWESILNLSVLWNDVPVKSRAYYLLEFKTPVTLAENTNSALTEPLTNSGFLCLSKSGKKYEFTKEARQFHHLLENLDFHDFFNEYNATAEFVRYLRSFYTNEERLNLTEKYRDYRKDDEDLVMQVGCAHWLSRFLRTQKLQIWNTRSGKSEQPLFDCIPESHQHYYLGRKIVQALIDGRNPILLTDVLGFTDNENINLAAKTIVFLLQNILVYLSIDENTSIPIIGIHPSIHSFINTQIIELDKTDSPVTACPPFLVDDMTTLLIGMSLKPIPVKQNDNEPYAKSVKEISSRFYNLPDECNYMYEYTGEDRMRMAISAVKRLKLAGFRTIGKKRYLIAQEKSGKWLKQSESERLEKTMRALRNHYLISKDEDLSRTGCGKNSRWFEVIDFVRSRYNSPSKKSELSGSIFSAFRKLAAAKHPVTEYSFIRNQILVENPFSTLFHSGVPYGDSRSWYSMYYTDDKIMVDAWLKELQGFILNEAIPYGLINLGMIKDTGYYAISLTDAGLYFLDELDALPESEKPCNSIMIQPNFDIVFMAPNPGAEVKLGQFCERLGSGVGTLFKISRNSILRSVSIGLDAKYTLEALAEVSNKPVPQNVKVQVKNWAAQCRKVSISTRILFTCPDKETALQVKSSGGDKVEQISDTVIAVSDRKFVKVLEKKLEKKGIFKEQR